MALTPEPAPLSGAAAALAGLVLVLGGCGEAPETVRPPAELVGTWEHGSLPRAGSDPPHAYVYLTISKRGVLSYAWYEAGDHGHRCTVFGAATLTRADDRTLAARALWPISTELAIERAPRREGERWVMTVEGVELERVSSEVTRTAAGFSCSDGGLVVPTPEQEQGRGSGASI